MAPLEHKAELAGTAWESALPATPCASASSSSATRPDSSTSRPKSSRSSRPRRPAPAARRAARRLRRLPRRVDELADGPSVRLVEAALRDKQRQHDALGRLELTGDDPARDPRYFASTFYWPDVLDPSYPVRRGRRAAAPLGGQPRERGLGGRDRGPDPARALTRARLGVHARRRALALRRDAPHADGQAAARRLGPRAGGDPARRLHLRGLAARGPALRLGMLGYFETKNIGRKRERARRSTRWAMRPARPTWSSTGPTRPSTPSTAAAGCGDCWRRAARTPSRGRRCWSAASSSSRSALRGRPRKTSSDPRLRRRARRGGRAAGALTDRNRLRLIH